MEQPRLLQADESHFCHQVDDGIHSSHPPQVAQKSPSAQSFQQVLPQSLHPYILSLSDRIWHKLALPQEVAERD